MPADVLIYTTSYCGYCFRAKALLERKQVQFKEIDVTGRGELRSWLVSASGQRTVPQIFINGESIGGYDELSELDESGKLDELLARAPSVDQPALRS